MFAEERATFQKQRELRGRQCHRLSVSPECCKAPRLEPFGKNTESCAIPKEDFGAVAVSIDEEEEVAGERVFFQLVSDQAEESVESLAGYAKTRTERDDPITRRAL